MSHKLPCDTTDFHQLLLEFDQKLAEETHAKGCQHCGGKLHQANYSRLGFGISRQIREAFYQERFSFCCARCRRRTTPPSIRFLGLRRFTTRVFVILSALRLSRSDRGCDRLVEYFGIQLSGSTWKRWHRWWHQHLPLTAFWRRIKARFPVGDITRPLARFLLASFSSPCFSRRLLALLRFLSPLSTGVRSAVYEG